MTNEEVTSLLKDAQLFWKKWKDVPLQFHGDERKWDAVLAEANAILDKHGTGDHVFSIVEFFTTELHLRSQEREAAHGTI